MSEWVSEWGSAKDVEKAGEYGGDLEKWQGGVGDAWFLLNPNADELVIESASSRLHHVVKGFTKSCEVHLELAWVFLPSRHHAAWVPIIDYPLKETVVMRKYPIIFIS